MVTKTLQPAETGGYPNSARLTLIQQLKNLNESTICFNRDSWKGWGINKRPINRWVYAFTSNNIAEVSRWKVDVGGGEIADFAPAVKFALHEILRYNAAVFFSSATAPQVEAMVGIVIARKGHMSLYAVMDAIECLVQREPPCDIDTFGFDAKAILQACDKYWNKAKAEYYEWEKSEKEQERHDFKPGDPVPVYIKTLREQMEAKHGVQYTEDENRERMRAAMERFKAEQGEMKFD